MKDIFFLHGLPRAGNTLFSSIMNQNPDVVVTANSICADMMGELFMLKHTDIFKNFPIINHLIMWRRKYLKIIIKTGNKIIL